MIKIVVTSFMFLKCNLDVIESFVLFGFQFVQQLNEIAEQLSSFYFLENKGQQQL